MNAFMRGIHIRRILKIATLVCAGILVLLLLTCAFLPAFVSSHTAQGKIQHALSSALKRRVAWSDLVMTWSGGLTLTGLTLGDGPAPLLKTDIDQIIIVPSAGRGTDGRFGIDLAIRIRNVRAELAPGPKKPPPPSAKDPLTLVAESIQRIQGFDLLLPLDLRVTLEAAPVQVVYRTPAPGKQLRLRDFSFRFAMPSLAAKPISAAVTGQVVMDGREAGNVSVSAMVSNLVTGEQRIHPASALCAVDVAAPGTRITLSGGLGAPDGFAARGKLDLPGLLAVAHPFLPPAAPKLEGNVELLLTAKSDANRDLRATLTVNGAGLAASGGSLKAKRTGPLDLKLQQRVATDHVRKKVEFPGGTLVIPGLLDAAWSASVTRPSVPERALDVTCGPVRLDLARALVLAGPFLPPGVPVTDLAGELSLHSLSLHLSGPKHQGNLAIKGFGIALPRVRLALKNGVLAAEGIDLMLDRAECPLSAAVPARVTADLRWSVRDAAFSGAGPFSLGGARGTARMTVNDLNLKSASPRRVAASAVLTQTLDLDRVSLGTRLTVKNIHEQLRLLARAAESGDISADLPECAVTVASLQGTQSGKRFGPVPLSASLTAADLRVPAGTGAKPALRRAAASVSVSDFLQVAAEAALSGGSSQRVATSGTARVDLKRALLFAAPFVPSGLKANGMFIAAWNLAAPLPGTAPVAEKNPLQRARAGLALVDTLELSLKLDDVSATVPSATGNINVTGLRTRPDLRIVSTGKGESVKVEGGVLFSGVSGLSGAAGKLPVQHGSLSLSGGLSGWKEFRLEEELRLAPLGIAHEAGLNVSRIDRLLEEQQPLSMGTLIKRLDATLLASVDGAFPREPVPLLPGIDVAGAVGGSARVDLTAGHDLSFRVALKTKDFGVLLANGTRVEGMRFDSSVTRSYALASSPAESWTPLSAALVRPAAAKTTNPGAADIAGRITDDLRGDLRGARSFSIRRVVTKVAGVPLELAALEGDLILTPEKSGISFVQADLLGGTLLARGVFDLLPGVPNITAASSLSNLDVTYLLPNKSGKIQENRDAEITGEVRLTAPVTPEQRELFEQLRLALNVRKIGANTIERALFSLDPYERNEQLVAQRKMLRLGTLKGLRASAVDGAFSMEGEARIKGVSVDLPKVERLRISELPLRQELAKNRKGIMALRGVLDLLRADTLVVGQKGELSLKRRMYEQ